MFYYYKNINVTMKSIHIHPIHTQDINNPNILKIEAGITMHHFVTTIIKTQEQTIVLNS